MRQANISSALFLHVLMSIAFLGLSFTSSRAAEESRAVLASEQSLHATVQDLQAKYGSAQSLSELSPHQAALQALEQNLTVQRGETSSEIAQQAMLEARAVFDPVLNFSVMHERSKRANRIETDNRFQSATVVDGLGRNVLDVQEFVDPRAPLVVFTGPRNEGFFESQIVASQKLLTGTRKTNTFDVSLEQNLPWGADLLLAYQAVDEDAFFVNNASAFSGIPNPPLNLIGVGSYGRPWVSSLLASLSIPLPGSKEFGEFAEQEVSIARSDLQRQRAAHDLDDNINATLLLVDAAYWRLTRALLSLQATRENLLLVEEQLKATERLYQAQSATKYDRAQVELELARVSGLQESAWNNYVQASNNMIALLDLPENQLLLPSGFHASLNQAYSIPAELAQGEDVGANPQRRRAEVDIALAQLELSRSETRTKPDLNVSADVNLIQSNRVFGHDSFGDSASDIFNPDITSQRYAIEYSYPWGNRRVRSERELAQAAMQRSTHLSKSVENQLVRQLRNARIQLASSDRRVEISARNLQLAQVAYDKAVAQKAAGLTRDLEVAEQSTQLLQARLNHIASLTERKEAESQLLAVLGRLSQDYAKRLSQTEFENYRLSMLAATNALHYFGSAERAEQ